MYNNLLDPTLYGCYISKQHTSLHIHILHIMYVSMYKMYVCVCVCMYVSIYVSKRCMMFDEVLWQSDSICLTRLRNPPHHVDLDRYVRRLSIIGSDIGQTWCIVVFPAIHTDIDIDSGLYEAQRKDYFSEFCVSSGRLELGHNNLPRFPTCSIRSPGLLSNTEGNVRTTQTS